VPPRQRTVLEPDEEEDDEFWIEELVRDCLRHFEPGVTEPYRFTSAAPRAHYFPISARKEAVNRLHWVGFPVRILDETDWSFEVHRIPKKLG